MTGKKQFLLRHKFPQIVEIFSERSGSDLRRSLDVLYSSNLYKEMQSGISDMHCRSNDYLAEELLLNAKYSN